MNPSGGSQGPPPPGQPNYPNLPPNRATVPQTWENTSLIPFLRQYYRLSGRYPNAEMEAEVEKVRRILDALDTIRTNPNRIHNLVLGIAIPPLNVHGTSQPALYPNSDTPQGEENRLLVTLVLLQHARLAPPIWLPPREPAERAQASLRSGYTGQGDVTYPTWSQAEALALQPHAPDPTWTGSSASVAPRPHPPFVSNVQPPTPTGPPPPFLAGRGQQPFAGNLNTPFGRGAGGVPRRGAFGRPIARRGGPNRGGRGGQGGGGRGGRGGNGAETEGSGGVDGN